MQRVRLKGNLQNWEIPSIHVDQGQGHTSSRETVQDCIPDPLQLREDLHWKDNQEACNKDEGTRRGLLQRNAGEVSRGRTCLNTLPPHQMGRHQSDRLGQETQTAPAERSPSHPDSNRGAPQPRCWPRSPCSWLIILKESAAGPQQSAADRSQARACGNM